MKRKNLRVVGLLGSMVPYHHIRWQTFMETTGADCTLLELTDKDEFPVLEVAEGKTPYRRRPLFAGRTAKSIGSRELAKATAAKLNDLRPDCVCLNGYSSPMALGAISWCLRARVPAVIMSESTVWDEKRNPLKEFLKSRVIRLCGSALVGGQPHAEYMEKLGMPADSIVQGYDVVDNAHFKRGADMARANVDLLRAQLKLPRKFFLACARFTPKKNLPALLDAYADYRKEVTQDPWDLVVMGEGEGREELEEIIAENRIQGVVHLPGAIKYDTLPSYYGLASAFIHASTTEQWGLVVNEAMASGLPVLVSTRCGCAQDLVDGSNGMTFDPFDNASITEAMVGIGRKDLAKMGARSEAIIARWSPARFAEELARAIVLSTLFRPKASWYDRWIIRLLSRR